MTRRLVIAVVPLAVLLIGGAVAAQDDQECSPKPYKSACVIDGEYRIEGLPLADQPVVVLPSRVVESRDGVWQEWSVYARQEDGGVVKLGVGYGPVTGENAAAEIDDVLIPTRQEAE